MDVVVDVKVIDKDDPLPDRIKARSDYDGVKCSPTSPTTGSDCGDIRAAVGDVLVMCEDGAC